MASALHLSLSLLFYEVPFLHKTLSFLSMSTNLCVSFFYTLLQSAYQTGLFPDEGLFLFLLSQPILYLLWFISSCSPYKSVPWGFPFKPSPPSCSHFELCRLVYRFFLGSVACSPGGFHLVLLSYLPSLSSNRRQLLQTVTLPGPTWTQDALQST